MPVVVFTFVDSCCMYAYVCVCVCVRMYAHYAHLASDDDDDDDDDDCLDEVATRARVRRGCHLILT